MPKMIGETELNELESLVCRFAIEHGDALPHREVRINEAGDPFRIDGWITPQIVLDHDEEAMEAYLAKAAEPVETHRWHGLRTPAVCCQVSDYLGKAHPFVSLCETSGESICSREDCPTHVEHHERVHPDPVVAKPKRRKN